MRTILNLEIRTVGDPMGIEAIRGYAELPQFRNPNERTVHDDSVGGLPLVLVDRMKTVYSC